MKKCIFVIGMHRSGTSAMARVINILGIDLGTNLYPPKPHNPSGLWEHKKIMEIHEALFDYLGLPWLDYLSPLPDNWWQNEKIKPLKQELTNIVSSEFIQSSVWGLKDPRLCRLMPLWHSILQDISFSPHFIYIFRNPFEVAVSLGKRNKLSVNVSLLLWLQYILESELATRGYPRVFISFNQLMADWRSTVARIEQALNIQWPESVEQVSNQVENFLSPDLKHHNLPETFTREELDRFPLIIKSYNALLSASNAQDPDLDRIFCDVFDIWKSGIVSEPCRMLIDDLRFHRLRYNELSYKYEEKEEQLTQLKEALLNTNSRLNEIQNTKSWKITAPLRSRNLNQFYASIKKFFF